MNSMMKMTKMMNSMMKMIKMLLLMLTKIFFEGYGCRL